MGPTGRIQTALSSCSLCFGERLQNTVWILNRPVKWAPLLRQDLGFRILALSRSWDASLTLTRSISYTDYLLFPSWSHHQHSQIILWACTFHKCTAVKTIKMIYSAQNTLQINYRLSAILCLLQNNPHCSSICQTKLATPLKLLQAAPKLWVNFIYSVSLG